MSMVKIARGKNVDHKYSEERNGENKNVDGKNSER